MGRDESLACSSSTTLLWGQGRTRIVVSTYQLVWLAYMVKWGKSSVTFGRHFQMTELVYECLEKEHEKLLLIFIVILKEERYIWVGGGCVRDIEQITCSLCSFVFNFNVIFYLFFDVFFFHVCTEFQKSFGFSKVRHFCISLMERVKQLSSSNPTLCKFSRHQVYSYDSCYCLKLSSSHEDDLVMHLIVWKVRPFIM